ncbi:hypothetical protein DIPPA_06439 [Diplonema papillatum]|nr:hypothetical protein DIPPA_06439 [Diplonema papillatum]
MRPRASNPRVQALCGFIAQAAREGTRGGRQARAAFEQLLPELEEGRAGVAGRDLARAAAGMRALRGAFDGGDVARLARHVFPEDAGPILSGQIDLHADRSLSQHLLTRYIEYLRKLPGTSAVCPKHPISIPSLFRHVARSTQCPNSVAALLLIPPPVDDLFSPPKTPCGTAHEVAVAGAALAELCSGAGGGGGGGGGGVPAALLGGLRAARPAIFRALFSEPAATSPPNGQLASLRDSRRVASPCSHDDSSKTSTLPFQSWPSDTSDSLSNGQPPSLPGSRTFATSCSHPSTSDESSKTSAGAPGTPPSAATLSLQKCPSDTSNSLPGAESSLSNGQPPSLPDSRRFATPRSHPSTSRPSDTSDSLPGGSRASVPAESTDPTREARDGGKTCLGHPPAVAGAGPFGAGPGGVDRPPEGGGVRDEALHFGWALAQWVGRRPADGSVEDAGLVCSRFVLSYARMYGRRIPPGEVELLLRLSAAQSASDACVLEAQQVLRESAASFTLEDVARFCCSPSLRGLGFVLADLEPTAARLLEEKAAARGAGGTGPGGDRMAAACEEAGRRRCAEVLPAICAAYAGAAEATERLFDAARRAFVSPAGAAGGRLWPARDVARLLAAFSRALVTTSTPAVFLAASGNLRPPHSHSIRQAFRIAGVPLPR